MQTDEEGFLYPKVNEALCISCGRCKTVCPIYQKPCYDNTFNQKVYAVKHLCDKVRAASTSGGVFTALSDYILKNGGVVYGAASDEALMVSHIRAETMDRRDKMRGSKYVQSEIKDSFRSIKADLALNKLVLFTGTPCQNAGLIGYLKGTDLTKLILCDIVCHGVPSALMWQEYITFVKEVQKAQIKSHSFRVKTKGWHTMCSCNEYENGKKDYHSMLSQLNMNLFLSDLLLRPSCYSCRFSSFKRCSDITIADFWGIERTQPEFDDNKGVSLVLVNTEKGNNLFNQLQQILLIKESTKADCLQRNLETPAPLPPAREAFWKDYHTFGYRYIAKRYGGYTIDKRIRQSLQNYKQLLKSILFRSGS